MSILQQAGLRKSIIRQAIAVQERQQPRGPVLRAPTEEEREQFFQPPELSLFEKAANIFLPKALEFKPPTKFELAEEARTERMLRTGALPSVPARLPFQKAEDAIRIPTTGAGRIQAFVTEMPGLVLEAIPRALLEVEQARRDIVSLGKGEALKVPFDATRIGEPTEEFQGVARRFIETWDTLDAEGGNPLKNGFKAFGTEVVPTMFDLAITGDLINLGAKGILKATKFNPEANIALNQLGYTRQTFTQASVEEFKQSVTKRLQERLVAGDIQGATEILRSVNVVGTALEGEGIIVLNKFGQSLQNIARQITSPLSEIKNVAGARPIGGQLKGLPGTRRRPGQAPAFGLSMEELENVGGRNLFNKAQKAKNIKAFEGSVTKAEKAAIEVAGFSVADYVSQVKGTVRKDLQLREARTLTTDELKNLSKELKNKEITEERFAELVEKVEAADFVLSEIPARQLQKYSPTRGEFAGTLPEVTGRPARAEFGGTITQQPRETGPQYFARRGDDIVAELGFETTEDARHAFDVYRNQVEQLNNIKKELTDIRKTRAAIRKGERLMALAKGDRRLAFRAIKNFFNLTDQELVKIRGGRDIIAMTQGEFKTFMQKARVKAEQFAEQTQARNELLFQIQEKQLDIEPLRQALKLPKVNNMTTKQLREFDATLQPYEKGDVFLSKRKLETIERTDLSGLKTYREIREKLAEKLDVKPEDLNNIKINELDRFKGISGLAEKGPFFRMIVEETGRLRLIREAEFLEIERELLKLARKIKTGLGQKLIPQQKNIRKWFEATDKSTVQLTTEEAELVKFMQDEWIKARDYLVKMEAMKKGINSDNYFTHVRRGVLEAVKEDGVVQAFKEVFKQYKLDEQAFNILDRQTGEIMALDKFFRFAMHRTGELKPTENIVRAFLIYMRTFKKKQALDEMVPLIDIYAHALTPKGVTKEGLLLHGNLIKFTKEWLNTQKGRRATLIAKQGGKIEWGLKSIRLFTTMWDLAGNISVTVITQIGEQAISYQLLGKFKYLKSKVRAARPKGKRITKKYRNFIGKNPWTELIEPMKGIENRLSEGIFIMFRDANIRRNRNFLLGSMTKEEWSAGIVSAERLAQLRLEIARWGVVDDAGSIIGATPEAGWAKQYKTWALSIMGSVARNLKYSAKFIGTLGKLENKRGKRAFLEFYRMLELGALILTVKALVADEDDDSLIGRMKQRAYQEAMTLYGAISPKFITSVPRSLSFMADLGSVLQTIISLERYQQSKFGEFEAGELKGPRQLRQLFTPRAIRQFDTEKQKELKDISAELLEDIKSGKLSVEAAKEKFNNEIQSLETRQKNERFEMKPKEYATDLSQRIKSAQITVEKAREEFEEYFEENTSAFSANSEEDFWAVIKTYREAIGADLWITLLRTFQNSRIEKVENGAVIIKRDTGVLGGETERSTNFREKYGARKGEHIADHHIPRILEGADTEENMRLVTVEEWERYTPVEVYLARAFVADFITLEKAQELIVDFKEGRITEDELVQEVGVPI